MKRGLVSAALAALLAAGAHAQVDTGLVDRIDRSLGRAGNFLLSQQDADGAWRSRHYGFFQDGLALTPLCGLVSFYAPQAGPAMMAAHLRAVAFLEAASTNDQRLDYPVYSAAVASWVVILAARGTNELAAQQRWLTRLNRMRLSPELGWSANDAHFGGWGYNPFPPKKAPGEPAPWSANLSATLFGAGALRSAGTASNAAVFREIRTFVERCQNFPEGDGGFFFSPGDAAANKAGVERVGPDGRPHFASYGSATADGLRGLLVCGAPRADPRVQAARRWLVDHFSATNHPGRFAEGRDALRDSYYFYYTWSAAHALYLLAEPPGWASDLAGALLDRQSPDGAWRNRFTDAREDDPLVATPLAGAALALCRKALLFPPEVPRPAAHGPVF